MSDDSSFIAMRVAAVVVDPTTKSPVIILRDIDEPRRYLPIFIGGLEATSIATALAGVQLPRPMTHDLMLAALEELGWFVSRVTVTELKSKTFYAELTLAKQDGLDELTMDARPSDSIALALRAEAPIFVAIEVLDEAGGVADETDEEHKAGPTGAVEAALSSVDGPPAQEGPAALVDQDVDLEDLDPDLFGKYKM